MICILILNLVETYICRLCNKACSSSQALSIHLVTHSEERPYICDEKDCKKAFKTTDSLSKSHEAPSISLPLLGGLYLVHKQDHNT